MQSSNTWSNDYIFESPNLPHSFLNSLKTKRISSMVGYGMWFKGRYHFKFYPVVIDNDLISFQYLRPHNNIIINSGIIPESSTFTLFITKIHAKYTFYGNDPS